MPEKTLPFQFPYKQRQDRLQDRLRAKQLLLLTYPSEIAYITGFSQFLLPYQREALCLVSPRSLDLLYPHFLNIPQHDGIQYHEGYRPDDLVKAVEKFINMSGKNDIRNVAGSSKQVDRLELLFDAGSLLTTEYLALQKLPILLTPLPNRFTQADRAVKDEVEQRAIGEAAKITSLVVNHTIKNLQVGVTEKKLAHSIDHQFEERGADGVAFPTIVAFGAHAALPHHQPGETSLKSNTPVLIDCGAKLSGYCSDMTRTVWFGNQPSQEFIKVEKTVLAAYQAGLEAINDGLQTIGSVEAKTIDLACRNSLKLQNHEQYFIHTTGHGLGLEIHEFPSLSSPSADRLLPNMTVTLEPGVYLPSNFGYRHENTLLITEKGTIELTSATVILNLFQDPIGHIAS